MTTSEDCIENGSYEQVNVMRQYINPAIYVEDDVYDLQKKPMLLKYSSHELHIPKIVKVKKCSCALEHNNCPCHYSEDRESPATTAEDSSEQSSNHSSESTKGVPIAGSNHVLCQCPSTKSLRRGSASSLEDKKADAAFQEWLEKKRKEQQRKSKLAAERAREALAAEKEMALRKERQNFTQWLSQKKAEEEKVRREKELRMEEERRRQHEEEHRMNKSKLKYELWLKEKQKQELEKKLEQKLAMSRQRKEKERRIAENAEAYEIWLRNSKNKPKPIPMNQGLISLKSSVSVSYINPNPWNPNIDPKPATQ